MLSLLACLSLATVDCYNADTLPQGGCASLLEDDCEVEKTKGVLACKWRSDKCTHVCSESKAPLENLVVTDPTTKTETTQNIKLKKTTCYEEPSTIGWCVHPMSMRLGSVEENDVHLALPGVSEYVESISNLAKTRVIPSDTMYYEDGVAELNDMKALRTLSIPKEGTMEISIVERKAGDKLTLDKTSLPVTKTTGHLITVQKHEAGEAIRAITIKFPSNRETFPLRVGYLGEKGLNIKFQAGEDRTATRRLLVKYSSKDGQENTVTVQLHAPVYYDFTKMITTDEPDRILTPAFETVHKENIYFKANKNTLISLQALAKATELLDTSTEELSDADVSTIKRLPTTSPPTPPLQFWKEDDAFDIPYIGDLTGNGGKTYTLTAYTGDYNAAVKEFTQEVPERQVSGSYNPFGRFATDAAITVLFKIGKEEQDKVMDKMHKNTDRLKKGTELVHYVKMGEQVGKEWVLVFSAAAFEIYQKPGVTEKYKKHPFKDNIIRDAMDFSITKCKAASDTVESRVKLGATLGGEARKNREDYAKHLGRHLNGKKDASRLSTSKIMGGKSANDVATACTTKKPLKQRYEWLHRVGHSLAGRPADNAKNLMLGTYHTNSHMITFETLLSNSKRYKKKIGEKRVLNTSVTGGDTLFAPKELKYTIYSSVDAKPHEYIAQHTFDLMGTLRPAVMLNVFVYNYFQHVYTQPAEPPTMPSTPKAGHTKGTPGSPASPSSPKAKRHKPEQVPPPNLTTSRAAAVLSTDTLLQAALGLKSLTPLSAVARADFAAEYATMALLFLDMDATFAVPAVEAYTGAAVATLATGDVALTLHALVVPGDEHYFAVFRAQGTASLLPVLPGLTFSEQRLLVMRDAEGTTEVYMSCTAGLADSFAFVPGLAAHVGSQFLSSVDVTTPVAGWYSLAGLNFDTYLRFRAPVPLASPLTLFSAGGVTLLLENMWVGVGVFTAGTTKDVSPSFTAQGMLRWGTAQEDEVALGVNGVAHGDGSGSFGVQVAHWVHPFGIDVTVTKAEMSFDLPFTEAQMQVSLDLCNISLSGAYSTTDGVALRGEATCDLQLAEVGAWFGEQVNTATGLDIPAEMPDMTLTSLGMSVCTSPDGHVFASGASCASGVHLWGTAVTPGGAAVAVHASMDRSRFSFAATVTDFAVTDTIVLKSGHLEFSLGGGVPAVVQLSASLALSSVTLWVEGEYEAGSVFLQAGISDVTLEDIVALGAELTGGSVFTVPSDMPDLTLTTLELSVCTFEADARCTKGVTVHGAATLEGVAVDLVITITPEEISFVGTTANVGIGELTVDTLALSVTLPRGGGGVSLTAAGELKVTDTVTLTISGEYAKEGYSLAGGVDGAVKVRDLVGALYTPARGGSGADTPTLSNLQATLAKTTTPPPATFSVGVSGHVAHMTLAGMYAAITGDTFPDVFPGLGDLGLSGAVVSVQVENGGVVVSVATTTPMSVPLFGGDATLALEGTLDNNKKVSVLGVLRWEADSEDSNFAMRSKEGTGLEISAGWVDDAVGVKARLPLMICIHDCSKPQAQKQIVYIIGELGIEMSGQDVLLAGSLEMQGKLTKLFGVPILHVSDVLVAIKVELRTRRVDEVKLAGKLELGTMDNCAVATSTRCIRAEGRLEIYTSAPHNNLVELKINSLTLGEMWDVAGDWITALRSLPMPSVLRDLGIQYLEKPGLVCPDQNNEECFALVRYQASEGLRLRGQINYFFGLKLGLDIEVGASRFYLKTVLQDVTLLGIFKIKDAMFEVTDAPSFKLKGSLSVPVLSLSAAVDGTIDAHGIDIATEMNFFGFVKPRVDVSIPFEGGSARVAISDFRVGVVSIDNVVVASELAEREVHLKADVSFMYFARVSVSVAVSEQKVAFTATAKTPVMNVACTATASRGGGFGLSFSFDFVLLENLVKAAKAVGKAALAVGKGIVNGVKAVVNFVSGLFGSKEVYDTPAQIDKCRDDRIAKKTLHSIIYDFREAVTDLDTEPHAFLQRMKDHPHHHKYIELERAMHTPEYQARLSKDFSRKVRNEYFTGIHDGRLKRDEPTDVIPLFPADFCHGVTTDYVYGCQLVQHDGTDSSDWFDIIATHASNKDNLALNDVGSGPRSWVTCMQDDARRYKQMYESAVLMAEHKTQMQDSTNQAHAQAGGLMDLANSMSPDVAQFTPKGMPTTYATTGMHHTSTSSSSRDAEVAAAVNAFGPAENLGIQATVRVLTDQGHLADQLVHVGGVFDLHNWADMERTITEAESLIADKMWEVVHKGKAVLQDLKDSIPPGNPTLVATMDTILTETTAEVEQIAIEAAPPQVLTVSATDTVTIVTAGTPDELSGDASIASFVAATEAKLVVSHDVARCGSVTKTHTVDEVPAFAVAGQPTCGSVYLRVEWTVSDTCGQTASVEQFVVVGPAYTDATGWASTPAQRVDFTMASFVDVAAGAPATHTHVAVGAYRRTLAYRVAMEESAATLVPGTCEWRYTRTWSAVLTTSEGGHCRAPAVLRFTQEVVVANDVAWFSPAVVVPSVTLLYDHRVVPTVQFAAPDLLAAVQPVYTAAQAAKGLRYTYDLSHTDVLDDPVVGPLTRTWTVAAPQCTPSLPAVVLTQRVTIVFPEPELGPAVPQTFGCGETQVHTKPHVTSMVDVCGPVTVRIVGTAATSNPDPLVPSLCGSRYETVSWQAFHRAACEGVGSSVVSQLVTVVPRFSHAPADVTVTTTSPLAPASTGGAAVAAACATPLVVSYADTASANDATCGHWTVRREWTLAPTGVPTPAGCVPLTHVQHIHVEDLEAPVWTHTPDAAVVVPFFENWRAAHPVPRAAETPHADMVALGIGVSHPTYLTSEDTVVRPWMHAAVEGTCRERGLATLHRTWTAGDRCGNEATFTQEVMLQHPPAALTSTQVWDAGAGLLAYAAGVDQLPSVCHAGKLVSTAGAYDALDGLQQSEEPACDVWDAHGCRLLSAHMGADVVAVHQVRPEFATFPPNATTYTNSTLDAYDVAGGLGYPTGEAYCATPFHIWHRDEAPVLVACGVWKINRVWKVQPHYQDCGTGDDYPASLTRERVQVITVHDVFAPQFASTPAAEVAVAFLNDYGPSVAGVPTVVDVATHADMAALNLTSYRINLTFADTVAFSAAGAAGCTDGLAVVERTWTTEDRCGSADSWRQTIRIEHPRRGGGDEENTGVMGHVSGFKVFSVGDVSAVDVAAGNGALGTQGGVTLWRSVFGPATAARPEDATLADNATEQCGAAVVDLTDVGAELAEFSDSLLMLPENLCTGPKLVECVRPELTTSCSVVANTTAPLAEAVVDDADNLTLVGEGQVYNFFTIDLDTWLVKQEVERRSWWDGKPWWEHGVGKDTPVQKPFMRVRAGGFVFVNVVYEGMSRDEDTLRDTLFEGESLGPDFVLFNMKQLCSGNKHADCYHHSWHTYPWHHLAWTHLHHTFASLQYGHHSNHLNLVNVSLPGTLLTQDSYVSVSIVDSEVFGQVVSAGARLELATTRFHCNLFVANAVCDVSAACPTASPTPEPASVTPVPCTGNELPATADGWVEYDCTNFITGTQSRQFVIATAGEPVYTGTAMAHCKSECENMDVPCYGFFHQYFANGNEICGYYTRSDVFDNPVFGTQTNGFVMKRPAFVPVVPAIPPPTPLPPTPLPAPTPCVPTPQAAVNGWVEYTCATYILGTTTFAGITLVDQDTGLPSYGAAGPVAYCQEHCDLLMGCVGFFYQMHSANEICGFYETGTFLEPDLQKTHAVGTVMRKVATPTAQFCPLTQVPSTADGWIQFFCTSSIIGTGFVDKVQVQTAGVPVFPGTVMQHCKNTCENMQDTCYGYFYQEYANADAICGFYTSASAFDSPDFGSDVMHGGYVMKRTAFVPLP